MGFDDACLECHAYVTLGKRSLHAAPLTTVSAPSSSRPRSSSSLQSPAVFIPSPWPTTPAYRYTYSSPSSALIAHRIPLQALHKSTPAFSPTIPTALLPYLAFFLLAATFGLAFYFSTYVPVSVFYPTHTLILMPLFATVCQKRRFPRASLPLRPQQAFWAGSAL